MASSSTRLPMATVRSLFWALTVPVLGMAPFHAAGQPLGSDQCILSYDPKTDWHQAFAGMKSPTAGSFENVPACDPLPLGVEAEHWVVLDERCDCTVSNNRWIELFTNVRYEWTLVGGGGYFSLLANDTTLGSGKPMTQQVLWHPPALNPDDQVQVTILVTAFNDDEEEKPVPLTLTGVFTINVHRKAVQLLIELPDGSTLQREVQRNDYTVEFACDPLSGEGGLEVIQTCEPMWQWEEGSEIDGDFTAPALEFLRDDFVVLSASGHDDDVLKMWCPPYASPCFPSPPSQLGLPDTLRFEWSSSLGMPGVHFPAGRVGRDVVFSTKDALVNQVEVTLTITDTGLQYPDPQKLVSKTFTILPSEKSIDAAVIATLADTPPPGKAELPPPAFPGQRFDPSGYAEWLFDYPQFPTEWLYFVYRPLQYPDAWYLELEEHGYLITSLQTHPWRRAVLVIAGSANEPPHESYPNLDAVRNWALPADDAEGAEHRGVYGVHLKTYARREVLQEIPHPDAPQFLDVLLEHGWTPMTRGELLPMIQSWIVFGNLKELPEYDRGEHKDQHISISGECSETITFAHRAEFRLSPKAVELSVWMTNREPIWTSTRFTAQLDLDAPASLQHSGMGFPTWDVYLGADGGELSKIGHKPQESVLKFIDRGEKKNGGGP